MYDDDGMAALRQRRARVKHFGETLRASKYSYRLKRAEYALISRKPTAKRPRYEYSAEEWEAEAWAFEDEAHTRFSDEFCEDRRQAALENFDLNMAFFKQLSGRGFLDALNGMLTKHESLQPVNDLREWAGVEGVYIMVLDRYKQAYIGQAEDIRGRIKRHWSGTKQFDRLIFGHKETSVLSIDSFRALDTSRIFAVKTKRRWELERRLVDDYQPDFLLNRVPGGDRPTGDRFLLWEVKRRQLLVNTPEEKSGAAGLVAAD